MSAKKKSQRDNHGDKPTPMVPVHKPEGDKAIPPKGPVQL